MAALWARTAVEGEAVEMGRLWVEDECEGLERCFEVDEGESVDAGTGDGAGEGSLRCVWIRVFTTSRGVVITPAIPPADAAVRISKGSPISFDPTHRFANARSSS